MDWIKKNPHLFSLALLALALLVAAGLVVANTQSFPQHFAAVQENVPEGTKLTAVDTRPIEDALQSFQKPAQWKGDNMMVPVRYVIDKTTNKPVPAIDTSFFKDTLTGRPIPNAFFTKNGLSLNDPKVQFQDPDKDGFLNEDEAREGTDPNDPKSHPPYYTKLFLRRFIRVSFTFIFQSWEGDRNKPDSLEFQINPKNMGGKAGHTVFLKLGDPVPNSNYVLKKFEYKTRTNPSTSEEEEVSELTLLNTETQESIVLILGKLIDSPDSYALFIYEWPQPNQQIQVKKTKSFVLLPEKDKQYKLIDINETTAVIETPDGKRVNIGRDPRLQ